LKTTKADLLIVQTTFVDVYLSRQMIE